MENKKFLTSYDNFLDIGLINQIETYMAKAHRRPIWKTSHFWMECVRRATSPIAILELPPTFSTHIHERLKKTSAWKADQVNNSMYYLYSPGGYVAWHPDHTYEFASMIFLNKAWNLDWGGLHLYEDLNGLGIRAEVPTFNKCIINGGGIPHAVSALTPDAPFRRVIVTFGAKVSPKEEERRVQEFKKWRTKRNMDIKHIADSDIRKLAMDAMKGPFGDTSSYSV